MAMGMDLNAGCEKTRAFDTPHIVGIEGLVDDKHIHQIEDLLRTYGSSGFGSVNEETTTQETAQWLKRTQELFVRNRNNPEFKEKVRNVYQYYLTFPPRQNETHSYLPGLIPQEDRSNGWYELENPDREIIIVRNTLRGIHSGHFEMTTMDIASDKKIRSHQMSRIAFALIQIMDIANETH